MKQAKVAKNDGVLRVARRLCCYRERLLIAQSSARAQRRQCCLDLDRSRRGQRRRTQGRQRRRSAGVALTLKRAIELALQNSADIATGENSGAAGGSFRDDHQGGISAEFVCGFRRGIYLRNSGNAGRPRAGNFQCELHAASFERATARAGERNCRNKHGRRKLCCRT